MDRTMVLSRKTQVGFSFLIGKTEEKKKFLSQGHCKDLMRIYLKILDSQ